MRDVGTQLPPRERLELALRSILDEDDALSAAQIVVGEGWRPPSEVVARGYAVILHDVLLAAPPDVQKAGLERIAREVSDG